MDPLFGGGYPADVLADLGADAPQIEPGDMDVIATPMDFLGINYYSRTVVSAGGPWDVHSSGLPHHRHGLGGLPRGPDRPAAAPAP